MGEERGERRRFERQEMEREEKGEGSRGRGKKKWTRTETESKLGYYRKLAKRINTRITRISNDITPIP